MLISPLQLEDNGLNLQWCHGYGIEFYQGTCLRLYTIRHSWHIILPFYLDLVNSVAVAQMPPAGTPAAILAADLDLIHCCLGHACEAMCHTHVQHSQLYSDAQKALLCSSHLSQLCCLCALGKQVASPHQKAPTPPEEHTERHGEMISASLLTVEVPSIGGAHYVLAVTDVSTCYHWTAPLRLKSDAMDKLHHIILSMPETHRPLYALMVVVSSSIHPLICGLMSRGFCILLHHHTPQSTTVSQSTFCIL